MTATDPAAVEYRALVAAIGGGFHPDTRDYTRLPDGYPATRVEAIVEAAFALPGFDPYAEALDIIHALDDAGDQPLPRSDDHAALCLGEAVTVCCGAFATFHDSTLCCKSCWAEVGR